MPEAMIAALVAKLGAVVVNEILGAQNSADQKALIAKAMARIGEIPEPELVNEIAQTLGPSEAGAVTTDPELRQAQRNALSRMQDVVSSGGYTLEDRANEARAMEDVSRRESAGRDAVDQRLRSRGMANSGSELAQSLVNQQQAADRGADVGLQTAAAAQKRYLQSILSQEQMAGAQRTQDFGENYKTAQARDEISKYNAAAQERAARQNNQLAQQRYQNAAGKANSLNQTEAGVGKVDQAEYERRRNEVAGVGQAVDELATGYGDTQKKKKDPADEWANPYGGY